MALSYEEAAQLLEEHGQAHVLRFWDRLTPDQRTRLLNQVAALDFGSLARMRDLLQIGVGKGKSSDVEPSDVKRLAGEERKRAQRVGEAALRAQSVGVLLVAGGQGSRLGFAGPKGAFPIGPITDASLFEVHSRKILALEEKHACEIPFYIMTSEANHEDTCAFFRANEYFGLSEARVRFFVQGMWPALWDDGRIVLDRPDHLFMSPDGHGGILRAMRDGGVFDDIHARGLKTLFYFQVDNPIVDIADPVFLGAHCEAGADMSIKVCAKAHPEEGLGVVVKRDGRQAIDEYTELTPEQMHSVGPDGRLKFLFGSVAIHVFSADFLERQAAADLPLHAAHKKVPYCDESGALMSPDAPNAYKFEKFIFDVVPNARRTLNLEFERHEEFSPVKNASGADSPQTARRDLILKYARRLEAVGVTMPRDKDGVPCVKLEIDPCFVLDEEGVGARVGPCLEVKGDLLLR